MSSGKRFRVKRPTLGIESILDRGVAVSIPANALIEIADGPGQSDLRMVDVVWQGRTMTMFALDIRDRCEEIANEVAHS